MPVGFTDHCLVVCNVVNLKPQSAYWHFNTTLSSDSNFKDVFRFFFREFLRSRKPDFNSLRQWWDGGKIEIKQPCQQYTLNVTRDIARSMRDLETGIVELQSLLESTGNRDHIEDLKSKRSALKDLSLTCH